MVTSIGTVNTPGTSPVYRDLQVIMLDGSMQVHAHVQDMQWLPYRHVVHFSIRKRS